ncbi:DUF6221 family protein [Streptomyces sp. SID10815]|uniref:DUF6221 family protein n=1 Tax=Streptomyces sp. SID10815 TaxID=2706027 RepID=UPI0023B2CA69|nr:DUF6221 family protein [Streptomyces sp. SID10815]
MGEFLRGRLSEDETLARMVKTGKDEGLVRLRDRVLADVEAKRRLLDWATEPPELPEGRDLAGWRAHAWDMLVGVAADWKLDRRSRVIYELVSAYEGHADFRDEWKLIDDQPEGEPVDHEKRR